MSPAWDERSTKRQARSDDDELDEILDKITALHPGIIFAGTSAIVTFVGCGLVLLSWLVFGPSAESSAQPSPGDVAAATTESGPATAESGADEDASRIPDPPTPSEPDDLDQLRSKLHVAVIGMHAYQAALRTLPVLPEGKRGAGLSWRVHILPFLGRQDLYDQFNLDEPWDGPTNRPLLDAMPDFFSLSTTDGMHTRMQLFVGPDSLFPGAKPAALADAKDGLVNTILLVVVKPQRAIPWTKPDELTIAKDGTTDVLGTFPDGSVEAVACDGEFISLPQDVPADALKGMLTVAGGEIVDAGKFRPQSGNVRSGRQLAELVKQGAALLAGGENSSGTAEVGAKLKDILLAMHTYHDTYRQFPVSTQLSWRVHLLPFLDQQPLFEKFHLDEPWDSEHNKALIEHMPSVFRTDAADPNATRFQVLVGWNTVFEPGGKPHFAHARDGAANTLLVVYTGADVASAWTQPNDLKFDPANPKAVLGTVTDPMISCGMVNGDVVDIPADVDPASFAALVTPNGKEIVEAKSLASRGSAPRPAGPAAASGAGPVAFDPAALERELVQIKTLGLAFQNYHDTYRGFPVANQRDHFDGQGRPFLSWRVHLLRALDHEPLFSQFKLNEAWDSPHNKSLLDKMPEVYRNANDPPGTTTTRFMVMTGPSALFERQPGIRMTDIHDGTSLTLLCVQVSSDRAVPWTKPDDAVFDPANPLAALGPIPPFGLAACLTDGVAFRIKPDISAELFKAIVTPRGGESISDDELNSLIRR